MRVRELLMPILVAASMSACASNSDPQASSRPFAEADGESGRAARLATLAADIEARGEDATAIALYQQAVALPDATPAMLLRLGQAYLRAGYPTKAIKAFQAVLSDAPEEGEALIGLGSALIRTGDFEAGVRALDQGAAIVDTASAYNRLGVARTLVGRIDEARQAYEMALEREPGDLDVRANLALALALSGNGPEAIEAMREVASSPTAQPRHKRNLVVVYGLLGRAGEIRKAPPSGLSSQEIATLLGEAEAIRSIGDTREQARALGAIAG